MDQVKAIRSSLLAKMKREHSKKPFLWGLLPSKRRGAKSRGGDRQLQEPKPPPEFKAVVTTAASGSETASQTAVCTAVTRAGMETPAVTIAKATPRIQSSSDSCSLRIKDRNTNSPTVVWTAVTCTYVKSCVTMYTDDHCSHGHNPSQHSRCFAQRIPAGWLCHFHGNLGVITKDHLVLETVTGYWIYFFQPTTKTTSSNSTRVKQYSFNKKSKNFKRKKVALVQLHPPSEDNFHSTLFLVPKKDGGQRLVINLKALKACLHYKLDWTRLNAVPVQTESNLDRTGLFASTCTYSRSGFS